MVLVPSRGHMRSRSCVVVVMRNSSAAAHRPEAKYPQDEQHTARINGDLDFQALLVAWQFHVHARIFGIITSVRKTMGPQTNHKHLLEHNTRSSTQTTTTTGQQLHNIQDQHTHSPQRHGKCFQQTVHQHYSSQDTQTGKLLGKYSDNSQHR